ncbi:MAG TPA: D-alanyl-D-alanine carboxypeptidase, partial [Gemmatimonadales bacterium]
MLKRFLLATSLLAVPRTAQQRPATGTVGRASDPTLVLPTALKRKVDAWYRTTSRRTGGSWGIAIADERGNILWSKNPDRPLLPASTVKVFTTSYALGRLGGEYTRETRVVGVGTLDSASGQWLGTWQLQLNGDPTLEDPAGMGPR